MWPRLYMVLKNRDNLEYIDAKFATWNPHYKECWAEYFTKNYQEIYDSDPLLFELLGDMDYNQNFGYESSGGNQT